MCWLGNVGLGDVGSACVGLAGGECVSAHFGRRGAIERDAVAQGGQFFFKTEVRSLKRKIGHLGPAAWPSRLGGVSYAR